MNWYDPIKRSDFSGLLLTSHFHMDKLTILNITAIADFYSGRLNSFCSLFPRAKVSCVGRVWKARRSSVLLLPGFG